MKKVMVNIEVDLKNDEVGFVIVPTSEIDLLKGRYAVVATQKEAAWNCRNSVTLIGEPKIKNTDKPKEKKATTDKKKK
ncbi:hypothetical protein [Herbaspirillum robiniae]|uniref:hypothetical protein n=1 Tax=Herbaspirillum robiniae TaxID=2014887 RepID=UPI003D78861D